MGIMGRLYRGNAPGYQAHCLRIGVHGVLNKFSRGKSLLCTLPCRAAQRSQWPGLETGLVLCSRCCHGDVVGALKTLQEAPNVRDVAAAIAMVDVRDKNFHASRLSR